MASGAVPFNSDEAIVGLMGRHILQGERPVFFYGQAYMGSLDAWLIALGFAVAGTQVWVMRAVQALLYLLTILTTYGLAWNITASRSASTIAGLLMAIPTVCVSLYTTVSIGDYGEALLIGNLLLLAALALRRGPSRPWLFLAWGGLAGLGLWVFGLTLIYSLASAPVVAIAWWRTPQRRGRLTCGAAAMAGAVIGASPWWGWAVVHGLPALVSELAGSAIAGASPQGWLASWASHLANLALFGPTVMMGLRAPWSIQVLAWPLAPLVLVFWLGVLGWLVLRRHDLGVEPAGAWLLAGTGGWLLAGFVLTPFGADPSGRYFLPVWVIMSVFAGAAAVWLANRRGRRLAWAAVGVVLAYNLLSTAQTALTRPPGITTQFDPVAQVDSSYLPDLVDFLVAHSETAGLTNYWVAYPLAFASQERLIYIPRLPYHPDFRYTSRDDRYPPYDDIVDASHRLAYITTQHPALDEALAEALSEQGVGYEEAWIGPYHVFYDLTRPVRMSAADLAPGGRLP